MTLRGPHPASALALLMLVAAATLVGCSRDETDGVRAESIVAPPKRLISSADISRTRPGSAERAFLRHWATLQYSSWSAALESFEPALVRTITAPQLVEALKTGASYFPTVAPSLRGTTRVGDQVVVRYQIQSPGGTLVTSSVSWRRTPAGWKIHYDPSLDGMLQASTQAQVQAGIDPSAAEPSKEAIQAGLAASRIQSQYLSRSVGGGP